jgi:thiamine kinase-like enzyme
LKTISDKMPGYTILFKKHPNQKVENLTYVSDSVFRIDAVFPVELLIACLKDAVIISSYSNSMLYHNPTCHYFWTYPIIAKSGELKKDIERFNPKAYIKVVQNFEEIENELSTIVNG